MEYNVFQPHPLLAKYVKCYWTLESGDEITLAAKERIFPDGCMELIFHFGDLFRKHKLHNSIELQPRSFIHGQLQQFIEIEPSGNVGIFSIRFQPQGLSHFLDLDMTEITEQNIHLTDLWGAEGRELEDKMLNARNNYERIAIIDNFLLKNLLADNENNLVEHCLQSILKAGGNLRIEDLADNFHVGRRQLERKFVSSVGLSPKKFSRIIRFQHTLRLIENKSFSSLTFLAYRGGFYDQAHFIRDFREFTGLSPRQYFSEDMELSRYFHLE